MVRYLGKTVSRNGDEGEEVGISCDSHYTKDVMEKVGEAIRNLYYWDDQNHPIFVPQQSGWPWHVHAVVDQYKNDLKTNWKVICIH